MGLCLCLYFLNFDTPERPSCLLRLCESAISQYGYIYTPTATATSGLVVTFSVDGLSDPGVCSISSGVVSFWSRWVTPDGDLCVAGDTWGKAFTYNNTS